LFLVLLFLIPRLSPWIILLVFWFVVNFLLFWLAIIFVGLALSRPLWEQVVLLYRLLLAAFTA